MLAIEPNFMERERYEQGLQSRTNEASLPSAQSLIPGDLLLSSSSVAASSSLYFCEKLAKYRLCLH
jgi:hypothetical protein